MQKFSDVVLDKNGKGVQGLTVKVSTYPGGQPATIYATDGGPAVASVSTDSSGRFGFYAANGHYSVTVSGPRIDTVTYSDIVLDDPQDWRDSGIRTGDGFVIAGTGSGAALSINYRMPANLFGYVSGTVGIGNSALGKLTEGSQTVAIGAGAMMESTCSFDNIAIGEVALQEVQSAVAGYSTTQLQGTRNVGIGGNAGQKLKDGYNNVFIGRNSGTGCVSTVGVTAIGAGALFGRNVNGWYATVENYTPNNNANTNIVAVGQNAGNLYHGISLTAVGSKAASKLKLGQNMVVIGQNAGALLENNSGFNGKVQTTLDSADYPYTKTGANMVITRAGHNAVVGGYVGLYPTSGPADVTHNHEFPALVTAVAGDTFTVQCPYAGDGIGTCQVNWTTSLVNAPQAASMVIIGGDALSSLNDGNNAVAIGGNVMMTTTAANSSVGIGKDTMRNAATTTTSIGIGTNVFKDNPGVTSCTAVGHAAGLLMQSGTAPVGTLQNAAMFGSNARVSGDNQVQLGDSATTTYVYGTVQNRSDLRDKADVRDTKLGLEFINKLRPVDYRWDMREDYFSVDENGTVTRQAKDGSKKRGRYHHGLIAQEVAAIIQSTGVDFGGFQDHKIDGGCDVLTIGYDELIAPLIKAVQELSARIAELEAAARSTSLTLA